MASVLEFMGVLTQSTSTPVPPLGVSNEINGLQIQSQKYFFIGKEVQAADDNQLAVSIRQNFLTTNQEHTDFLNQCTDLVKAKTAQLKSIDQKIGASIVFGVTATALSFLPLVGFLGWVGWGAAAYYINQRATVYAEYQESLKLLVGSCNWSLGEGPQKRHDKIPNLTTHEAVRNMMTVLYPVLTETQVRHLIADDIEGVFAKELLEYEHKFTTGFNPGFFTKNDENIALSKKGAEFTRCIYGFNKGNFTDFLDAILSILPDLYRAAQHGCQRLHYWYKEKSHPQEQREVEAAAQPSHP